MSSDFQAPNENPAANHSEAPMAETTEAKSAGKNKGKYKLLLWLNLLWVIPLVVFWILNYSSSFEIEGTVLRSYEGSAVKAVIPKGVTEIEFRAFKDCQSLTSVVIPEGVKEIGIFAFSGCSSLKSVVIPEGVTEIEWEVFNGCSSLTSVEIPKGVTEIGQDAFSGCSSLTSVVIPEGVTEIGMNAFNGCNSLTSVVIPESVKEIEYQTFEDCPKLTIHAPAGSYAEKYAKENGIPFEVK